MPTQGRKGKRGGVVGVGCEVSRMQDDGSPKQEGFATLQREAHVLNNKEGKVEGALSELRKIIFAFMGGRGETLSAEQSSNKKRKPTKASERES